MNNNGSAATLQCISQLTDSVDFHFQPRLIFNILTFLRFSACTTAVEKSYRELINRERIASSQPKYIFKKKTKQKQNWHQSSDISFLERRFVPVLIDSLPEGRIEIFAAGYGSNFYLPQKASKKRKKNLLFWGKLRALITV